MKYSKIISNNIFMLKYLFLCAPIYTIVKFFLGVLTSTPVVIANVVILKYIIDIVVTNERLYRIIIAVSFFAIYIIIAETLGAIFTSVYEPKMKEKISYKMQSELYRKATSIDLSYYDNPEYYSDFIWSMSIAENKAYNTLNNLQEFCNNLVNFILLISIFASIDKIVLLILFVTIIFSMAFNNCISKNEFEREQILQPLYRKKGFIARSFYLPNYAKEIRLSKISNVLKKNNDEVYADIINTEKRYNKKISIYRFLQTYFSGFFISNFVIVLYLGYSIIVKKSGNISGYAAVFNGVDSLLVCLNFFANKFVVGIKVNGLFVEKFKSFLNCKSIIKTGNKTLKSYPETISFDNVSYRYDNENRYALNNITIDIESCEKIALVGSNGAGKTTFVKLLMRLYEITMGKITIGNTNLYEYGSESLKESFGVIFQNYQLFSISIAHNVSMSLDYDEDRVLQALCKSGISSKLKETKNSADSVLFREFDKNGILVSGGEAQKIALARVIYKDYPFIILDEPTASLDVISEELLYQTISSIAPHKTVIYVSHRLSTTKNADIIYVMDNGHIVERGTHHELLKQEGMYSKMWSIQSQKYK